MFGEEIAAGRSQIAGQVCGMTFTYNPAARPIPPRLTSPLLQSAADLTAFVNAPVSGPGSVGARCVSGSAICRVLFDYHGFTGEYSISRNHFCEWQDRTQRIVELLDKYRVN
jgi:hypothetical protein